MIYEGLEYADYTLREEKLMVVKAGWCEASTAGLSVDFNWLASSYLSGYLILSV